MVVFPNAKINLGLNVTNKRNDGYHDVSTVILPVINLYDVLEIVPLQDYSGKDCSGKDKFSVSGIDIPGKQEENLCLKAVNIMRERADIPPLNIFLHKVIPIGSGLGGGSSDAAFMLKALNQMYDVGLDLRELEFYAAQIGADCPFFIRNSIIFAEGIGNLFSTLDIVLPHLWIEIVVPPIHVSTQFAYQKIVPHRPQIDLKTVITLPINKWRNNICNDFEKPIFEKYPELRGIKDKLYANGAIYASMSGSGSAVYGLFRGDPVIKWDSSLFVFSGAL